MAEIINISKMAQNVAEKAIQELRDNGIFIGSWTLASVRTPKHGGEYLLYGKICADDDENYCFLGDYFEFEEKFGIETSNYDPHTLGFLDTEIDEYYSVVAWMPLPKPPQGGKEKKDAGSN